MIILWFRFWLEGVEQEAEWGANKGPACQGAWVCLGRGEVNFFYRRFGFCLFLFGGRAEVWKSWRQLFVVTDFCLSFEERGGVNYVDFLWSLEMFISCHSASIICKLILADFWPVKANWPFVNSQISLWRHYFFHIVSNHLIPISVFQNVRSAGPSQALFPALHELSLHAHQDQLLSVFSAPGQAFLLFST